MNRNVTDMVRQDMKNERANSLAAARREEHRCMKNALHTAQPTTREAWLFTSPKPTSNGTSGYMRRLLLMLAMASEVWTVIS